MSPVNITEPGIAVLPSTPAPSLRRGKVVINDQIAVPGWVEDLGSYRRWIYSGEFPERGRIGFLHGEVWVDLSMEEFFTHSVVKAAFSFLFLTLQETGKGRFVPDRMILTNESADLSTEPDGLFYFWSTIQSGKLTLVERHDGTCLELCGSPDVVLEIVSKNSVRKDTMELMDLYWRAGIPEYWLVDVRKDLDRFDIFSRGASAYEQSPIQDGWVSSKIFNVQLRLERKIDPLKHPLFKVLSREMA
ncbi:MAG: Uma2 family endonuclease [Gemmataceae bacterium]